MFLLFAALVPDTDNRKKTGNYKEVFFFILFDVDPQIIFLTAVKIG